MKSKKEEPVGTSNGIEDSVNLLRLKLDALQSDFQTEKENTKTEFKQISLSMADVSKGITDLVSNPVSNE